MSDCTVINYSNTDKLIFQMVHHRHMLLESIELINLKLEQVEEYAYSGDIVSTLHSLRKLKFESNRLIKTINHLLSVTEDIQNDMLKDENVSNRG